MFTLDANGVQFQIRTFKESDIAFIFSTWLKGLYYGNSWFREIPKDIFMENYHRVIERILERESVSVLVACLSDDPETILGYAAVEPSRKTIHWIHIKEAWRRLGIASALTKGDWECVSHLTMQAKGLKPKDIIFNPFIV